MLKNNFDSLGSPPGYFQQAEDDVLLVLAHDQVVRFEEEALDDLEALAAPSDEVAHVVSGKRWGLEFSFVVRFCSRLVSGRERMKVEESGTMWSEVQCAL